MRLHLLQSVTELQSSFPLSSHSETSSSSMHAANRRHGIYSSNSWLAKTPISTPRISLGAIVAWHPRFLTMHPHLLAAPHKVIPEIVAHMHGILESCVRHTQRQALRVHLQLHRGHAARPPWPLGQEHVERRGRQDCGRRRTRRRRGTPCTEPRRQKPSARCGSL